MADRVGQQLGNYRLLRKIGQGAFAEVYLGEHLYLERPAAIKVLHVQMEPQTHEQFRREARTIAHLQHPHIVQVFDFGLDDQTPYLVMEYTPGGTLRSHHPKGTRLSLEQIVMYMKQIASALDYAHQQRVIHRDVKPENLLLNAKDEVVLSDFGIAVVHQTREPLSMQDSAGTPLYMAPEQIRGKPCPASDQYALAVVVYEWLCGEPPFRGSLFEVYSQHLSQLPPGLCGRVPDLPSVVEDAVLGALAKDPQQRFSSVQDFATVLEQACLATQPLVSPMFAEQRAPEPYTPLLPLSAPRARAEDLSGETTHLKLMPSAGRGDEQEAARQVRALPVVTNQSASKLARPSVAQTNRERLLRKVRAFWITGVLEHSLHGFALIALGLKEQPDAIATPWHLVLHHPAGTPRPLLAGTRITQVYDAAEGELLILGAPGSGKTTLLLELARELLARAEHDEQHPLPVVFNLSSWTSKQPPLADWLVEELNRTYQVPRTLGQAWVETDQILPLLDGLDEVATRDRTACIETINTYREEHGLLPLVVCSRSADYLAQTARVRLGSAVMVQPLTQQQVDDYLASGDEPLWALRVALHRDTALRELTSTPLMLSILTLTYHGLPVEELLRGASVTDRQRQIFEHYVERMLRQRGSAMRYTPEQTTHWLAWLARQMKRHNQTVFYIEHLQPDWLTDRHRRLLYRLSVGPLVGLAAGLWAGLAAGQIFDLTSGLSAGLAFGLVVGLPIGLVLWLAFGLGQIQPREMLTRSWRGTKQNIVAGLVAGSLSAPLIALVGGLSVGLFFGLIVGLPVGLIVGLLVALVSGFSTNLPDDRMRLAPNQGIWRSAQNGLLMGLLIALAGGLSFELVYRLLCLGCSFDLTLGLSAGLLLELGAGLIFGLGAFLQHFTLRFQLWCAGSIPWNYPRFLDYAAERILLRKVGGGYIFVHRLLLEYFASLDMTPPPDAARAKKEQAEPAS
ncbi:MAG: protein kinase domain-containing protein [Ktedonobacteraceae bacterium]